MPAESVLPSGDLVDRLRSALDEAERIAHAAMAEVPHNASWRAKGGRVAAPIPGSEFAAVVVEMIDPAWAGVGQHIAANDPASALRTIQAHRRLIELAEEATSLDAQVDLNVRVGARDEVEEPYLGDLILGALASIYFPEGTEP